MKLGSGTGVDASPDGEADAEPSDATPDCGDGMINTYPPCISDDECIASYGFGWTCQLVEVVPGCGQFVNGCVEG